MLYIYCSVEMIKKVGYVIYFWILLFQTDGEGLICTLNLKLQIVLYLCCLTLLFPLLFRSTLYVKNENNIFTNVNIQGKFWPFLKLFMFLLTGIDKWFIAEYTNNGFLCTFVVAFLFLFRIQNYTLLTCPFPKKAMPHDHSELLEVISFLAFKSAK